MDTGTTVGDLVAALPANTHYTTSTPVDVTIDGYRGKQLDVLQPSDLDPSNCDVVTADGTGRYFPFGGSEGGLYSRASATAGISGSPTSPGRA